MSEPGTTPPVVPPYLVELIERNDRMAAAIVAELPSWAAVTAALDGIAEDIDAMDTMAEARAVLKKILTVLRKTDRALYLLARQRED